MAFIQEYAIGQFGKRIVNKLAKKGIVFNSVQMLPGDDGSFANGETGYYVSDNGTGRMFTALQILELAK